MKLLKLLVLASLLVGLTALAAQAADAPDGKKLFLDNKCNSCHAVQSQGIAVAESADDEEEAEAGEEAPKAPDLSGVGITRKADWIGDYLMKKVALEERKHRKRFAGSPADLKALSGWLATLKTEAPKAK